MALQVTSINNMGSVTFNGTSYPTTGMKDNDHMHLSEDFLYQGGVVDLTTDFLVIQNSPLGKSILVQPGRCYVPNANYTVNQNSQTKYWRVVNDANFPVTITDNASGNPRIDLICLKITPGATPGDDGQNSATLVAVAGTPAASPAVPSVPADGNSYIILARIAVANGFTQIITANITDARINTSLDASKLGGVPTSLTYYAMARQAVMNSNFDIWQRNTSFTVPGGADTYTADRWKMYNDANGGTLPTVVVSRQSLAVGDIFNSFFYARINVNGAGSGYGANAQSLFMHPIEHGTRMLAGASKQVTVSFWAKSNIATKRLGLSLSQIYGTGGSPSSEEVINGTNVTLTSSWQKFTYTFTLNTLVGKTFGTANNDYLRINFMPMWGTSKAVLVGAITGETFVGSGNIEIAQVQLCEGNIALPYKPKTFVEELVACQRFYEKSYNYESFAGAAGLALWTFAFTNNAIVGFRYKVTKRTTPTCVIYSDNGTVAKVSNIGGSNVGGTVTSVNDAQDSLRQVNDSGTGFSAGTIYLFHWTSDADFY